MDILGRNYEPTEPLARDPAGGEVEPELVAGLAPSPARVGLWGEHGDIEQAHIAAEAQKANLPGRFKADPVEAAIFNLAELLSGNYRGDALRKAFETTLLAQLEMQLPLVAPAPGANYPALAVPAQNNPDELCYWEFLGGFTKLTTDATVGNRYIFVYVNDALGNAVAKYQTTAAYTASSSGYTNIVCGISVSHFAYCCLPPGPLYLFPNQTIQIATNGVGAADQLSQGYIRVRDWSPSKVARVIQEFEQRYAAAFSVGKGSFRRYP